MGEWRNRFSLVLDMPHIYVIVSHNQPKKDAIQHKSLDAQHPQFLKIACFAGSYPVAIFLFLGEGKVDVGMPLTQLKL